jgi:hypothetical protein
MARRINMQKFARELMGKQVRFTHFYRRTSIYPELTSLDGRRREPTVTWEVRNNAPMPDEMRPRLGWIVGIRWLQTGVKIEGSGTSYFPGEYDDYDPPTFRETEKRKLAYLVAPTPASKAIPVPPEAIIEVLSEYVEPVIGCWDETTKKYASQDSQAWPRDRKGRFSTSPAEEKP